MSEPALSPEQWEKKLAGNREPLGAITQHGVAALALYGQPFGFTRKDVAIIRRLHEMVNSEWGREGTIILDYNETPDSEATNEEIEALAERIEALLPPEKK